MQNLYEETVESGKQRMQGTENKIQHMLRGWQGWISNSDSIIHNVVRPWWQHFCWISLLWRTPGAMGADVIAMAIDCPDDGPKKLQTISISGVDIESSETRGRKPTSGCKAAKIDADVFPQWKTSGTASDDCQKKPRVPPIPRQIRTIHTRTWQRASYQVLKPGEKKHRQQMQGKEFKQESNRRWNLKHRLRSLKCTV